MAEVTGDLGGQPIQLNNAATEATLRQLLAAMTVIANNTGKDKAAQAKSQKELEAELKRLAAAAKKTNKEAEKQADNLKKSTKELDENTEAVDKNTKKLEDFGKSLQKGSAALQYLGSQAMSAATGMTNMLSALSNAGNSLSGAAAVFGQLPIVGGVLGTMFGAVAGAAEKTYEAFKKSASVGANFGGSITEMIDSATGAGLTFDQFSGIIAKTGKDLALLGGDSEAGARRLAALGKEIKGSPIARELNRLGYSTEAINEGMATYAGQLAKTGSLQGMTNSQLVASTGAYLKDLDALTKLTGKNKKELEDERNARLKDAQFRFIMSKMDVDSQKNLQNLMDTIPKEHQEGMKEIIATGTATSEAGKAALAFLPESSRNMMQLNAQIRTTGKMGAQQTAVIADAYQNEAKRIAKTDVAGNMAQFGTDAQKQFYIGLSDAAAREKTYGQVQAEATKAAEERKKKESELKDKGLDPANMEAYKNKIAETSNEFTKFLANSGLLDIMMVAFEDLVDIVKTYVIPGFNWLVANFDTVIDVAKGVVVGFLAYKAVMAALALKTIAQTVWTGLTLIPLKGMVAGLIGVVATLSPFALIVIGVVAAVTAAVLAFRALYKAGWDVGTVFEAVGDKLYDVLVLNMQEMFLAIRSFLPSGMGGISKEQEKLARENIAKERQDLKQRELARDAARADKRAARGIKDDEVEATTASTTATNESTISSRKAERQRERELSAVEAAAKAKEKETQAVKDAANAANASESKTPGVDLSSPQAMYDSMVKRQKGETAGATNQPGATSVAGPATNQPGATSVAGGGASSSATGTGLGFIAEKYESAGRGSGTVGWDKMGGTSYGKKQISSKTGAMTDYLKFLEKSGKGDVAKELRDSGIEKDTGSTSGKAVDVWKKLAASGKLGDSEGEFLKTQSYDAGMKGIKDQDLKTRIENSKALQEMMYSTAVQHGPGGAMSIMNSVFKKGMTDEQLVKAVYKERGTKFGGSTANVQAGVAKRFANEEQDIMGLLKSGGKATATDNTPARAGVAGAPTSSAAQTALAQSKPLSGVAENMALYGQPGSNIPTTAAVQTAVTPNTQQAEAARQQAEAARQQAAATDPRRTDRPQTAVAGARQESPESLLASLNTKMDQLITINRKLSEVNERQLSKLGNIAQNGDLYSAAM
jgi:septal ring factor EnvC (AmiA/AmiB activator)